MNRTNSNNLLCLIVAATLIVTFANSIAAPSTTLEGDVTSPSKEKGLQRAGLLSEDPNEFPFKIEGSRFVRKSDDKPVFLSIIGYQPLEPEQPISGDIRERRVRDDLRRWRAYQGGSNPVVIRVYPGPTPEEPNRMPQIFYDGVRELGFWIIRNIYVSGYYWVPTAIQDAYDQIDRVIAEVNEANAFDLIFAWEIGNEFGVHNSDVAGLEEFICQMSSYIKERVREVGGANVSNWVTWAAGTFHDPLWTWDELPVMPDCLDYIGYNIYGYEPERMRDHQTGPTTGTHYQGYLAALKERYPNTPLVITETGLSDSNSPEDTGDHARLHPWYPVYRKGGLTSEQVAEGLADRYWDTRLLQDDNDPNMVIAGLTMFEWNDEWHKGESPPGEDNGLPEEHFGLGRFEKRPNQEGYQLRYELQQETIHDLYTLNFDINTPIIQSLTADANTLAVDANTWVRAVVSGSAAKPVRFRWEASRGYIIGDGNSVEFYSGNNPLGLAKITLVAIDANSNASVVSTSIKVETSEPNQIEILTLGTQKASGRVYNVDLSEYKLVCYLNWDNVFDVQPYKDTLTRKGMKSIWIAPNGYWWTKVHNNAGNNLYCWLVPEWWDPPNQLVGATEVRDIAIAEANTVDMDVNDYNDGDNDLLPDWWELDHFKGPNACDRYHDPDQDMGNNLEEFLRGMDPNDANDDDKDELWDNWEYHYFGDINLFDANDDPDGDGLKNWQEQDPNVGTHPARASGDKDRDGLPDTWEMRWFGNLVQDANQNFDNDCFNNLDEYELGLDPTICMGNLDYDWDVDWIDYSMFAVHWREADCNEPDWCGKADLNRDGEVNWLDLLLLTENWLMEL